MTAARIRGLMGSGVVHVLFAFVAMGSWAAIANSQHTMPKPMLAGLVQGTLSAGLTFFLKSAIDSLSQRFHGPAALWAPPLIACLASASLLVAIHALSGTPEILRTIAVPLLVSTSYATIYNRALYGQKERDRGNRR
jgi:hypothetical protein